MFSLARIARGSAVARILSPSKLRCVPLSCVLRLSWGDWVFRAERDFRGAGRRASASDVAHGLPNAALPSSSTAKADDAVLRTTQYKYRVTPSEQTEPTPQAFSSTVNVADDPPLAFTPTTPPPLPATPRLRKVSGLLENWKRLGERSEIMMLNIEMDSQCAFKPHDEFLETYVPGTNLSEEQLEKIGDFRAVPVNATQERRMYHPLFSVIDRMYRVTDLPYTCRATGDHPESALDDMKLDGCTYKTTDTPMVAGGRRVYDLDPAGTTSKRKEAGEQWQRLLQSCQGRTSWAWISTFVEVKVHPDAAPFVTQGGRQVPSETKPGRKSRAQMARYAAELMRRQHRTFVLTVFIHKSQAWFMRWDRTGAIASTPVDYISNPAPLLNFFYRLTKLDDAGQGYDTSVTRALSDQVELFKDHASWLKEQRSPEWEYAEHAILDPVRYPVYAVRCDDVGWMEQLDPEMKHVSLSGPRTHTYLIGRPRSSSLSPTGRGSKGFIAYDVDRKRLVWLKDYWCAKAEGVHPELDTYYHLARNRVKYVATAIAGGNVVQDDKLQVTITQDLLNPVSRPALRFHHRLVLWEIGKPLTTYAHGGRLLRAVRHALYGHKQAWEKAGILHRDVSIGNILINVRDDKAFLNDWDLCKYKTDMGTASQAGRSGTWPFMSGTLLEFPRKPNDLADDIESFVYVIWLSLLRFHVHSLSYKDWKGQRVFLASHLYIKYQECAVVKGGWTVGGATKIKDMKSEEPGFELDMNRNQAELLIVVAQLARLGRLHYASLDLDALRDQYGVPYPSEPQPPQPANEDAYTERFDEDDTMSNESEGPESDSEDDTSNVPRWNDDDAVENITATPCIEAVRTTNQSAPTAISAPVDGQAAPPHSYTTPTSIATPVPHPTSMLAHVPPQLRVQSSNSAPGPSRTGISAQTGSSMSAAKIAELKGRIAAAVNEVTGDFNSHGPIIRILEKARLVQRWKNDKVEDQFVGLKVLTAVDATGSTGSKKRRSDGEDLNPSASQSRSRQTSRNALALESIEEPAVETYVHARQPDDVFSSSSVRV